jgi:hypothetical protein
MVEKKKDEKPCTTVFIGDNDGSLVYQYLALLSGGCH